MMCVFLDNVKCQKNTLKGMRMTLDVRLIYDVCSCSVSVRRYFPLPNDCEFLSSHITCLESFFMPCM